MEMRGIYWLLWWLPMWATALLLYFFIIGILFIIRDRKEKLPYNVSVASQQGDLALIGIILISTEVIKEKAWLVSFVKPLFLNSIQNQVIFLLICFIIGCAYYTLAVFDLKAKKRVITAADTYHAFIVVPLLVFLLFGFVFSIVSIYGTRWEIFFSCCLLAVWLGTVVFDAKQGRLDQPEWLGYHGIHVPIKRIKWAK